MSGRLETDQHNHDYIKEHLEQCHRLIANYMTSIEGKKTTNTQVAYLKYIMEFEKYTKRIGIDLVNVKPMDIDEYKKELMEVRKNGPSIINAKLSALMSFYKFLVKNDIITKNPCDNEMKLKIDKKDTVVYMTDDDVDLVQRRILYAERRYPDVAWRKRDLCIIKLGCSTGLRISALLNIDVSDVDLKSGTIEVIEKGDKRRLIFIGDNTIHCLKEWMEERERILGDNPSTNALFISNRKKRLSKNALSHMLHSETEDFDSKITPHKMRSTCGMKLYNKTGDIYLTAQHLGHADVRNTMIYAKATEEKRRMAANILD